MVECLLRKEGTSKVTLGVITKVPYWIEIERSNHWEDDIGSRWSLKVIDLKGIRDV